MSLTKAAHKFALSTALMAGVLLGTATPNGGGASPILTGYGSWMTPAAETISFQVSVVELSDGTVKGRGVSTKHGPSGSSAFHFEVTEYLSVGNEMYVAGIITKVKDALPGWLGQLTMLGVQDNGSGVGIADKMLSGSGLPPSLTIAQILSLPPPMGPPPPAFWPSLTNGNFTIH